MLKEEPRSSGAVATELFSPKVSGIVRQDGYPQVP